MVRCLHIVQQLNGDEAAAALALYVIAPISCVSSTPSRLRSKIRALSPRWNPSRAEGLGSATSTPPLPDEHDVGYAEIEDGSLVFMFRSRARVLAEVIDSGGLMPADVREAVSETGFRLFGYEKETRYTVAQVAAAEP